MSVRAGTSRRARRLAAGVAVAGCIGAAISALPATGSTPVAGAADDGSVDVLVDDGADTTTLTAAGGRLIADYGSYALWRVAASTPINGTGVTPAGNFDKIPLRSGTINTATDTEPPVPADLRDAADAGKELRIVQFAGPILPEWIDGLKATGLRTVSYLPPNAYVVFGDTNAVGALTTRAASDASITYEGPFRPAYRLAPDLQETTSGSGEVDVVVQVVAGEAEDIAAAKAAGTSLAGDTTAAGFTNLELRVPKTALAGLSRLPGVVNVERRMVPVRMDEAQGQIVAGNVQTSSGKKVPTGPGYLNFLASKSVSTTSGQHPRVAVVDDGVDNGTTNPLHNDFRVGGAGGGASRLQANFDCTGGGNPRAIAGHGNINAGIIGGYNNGTGAAHEDANGFNYGLGIDPYARLTNIKIFTDGGSFNTSACASGGTNQGIVERAFAQGANITSNSWGADVGGAYNASSQQWDAYTRDASTTAGTQPMFHVFSAGNAGPGQNTIGSPGTAKNVLTVGATENVRDQGVLDGCNEANADNADDMAGFSSRGPTDDGRTKPEIVAPGTHVQGPASQAPGYNGTGVCGPMYYPLGGQTRYTWSSGTSHSAPAVSGAAALAWEYYRRALDPGVSPSPAMLKALVLNTPRYLNGLNTGGSLPGIAQGWGDVNLSQLYVPNREVDDQTRTFTASGQQEYRYYTVADSGRATRITLAWSDAPGATVGNSFVNDLDLIVLAGGKLYRGNVFNGSASTTGGSFDARNNVEQVWIPKGLTGRVTVQVVARNIAGDGVPGGMALDQDFALSASNVDVAPAVPNMPYVPGASAAATGPGTNGDSGISPGEPIAITAGLANLGPSSIGNGTLTASIVSGPGGLIVSSVKTPTIAGNSAKDVSGIKIWALPSAVCNTSTIRVRLRYTAGGRTGETVIDVPVAAPFVTHNSSDVPKTISDNATASSTLALTSPANIRAIRLRVTITHTYDGDLVLRATGPGAQTSLLAGQRGGNGDNYTGTVFDDNATNPITAGLPPFAGSFRPETPLSVFIGTNATGTWTFTAQDVAGGDTGVLNAWALELQGATCPAVTRGVAVVNAPNKTEGDGGGTTPMAFQVVRTGPVGSALDVRVSTANGTAAAPGDYTARSNVLVHFAAGETAKTVNVSIRKDNANESNETVKLNLTSVPAGVATVRGSAGGTIVDDD